MLSVEGNGAKVEEKPHLNLHTPVLDHGQHKRFRQFLWRPGRMFNRGENWDKTLREKRGRSEIMRGVERSTMATVCAAGYGTMQSHALRVHPHCEGKVLLIRQDQQRNACGA